MQSYSTSDQSPRFQYDYWHSLIEQSFAVCDGRARAGSGFDATLDVAHCGAAEITRLRSAAVGYDRTSRHVRQSGTDDFFVSVMLDSNARFSQNDRAVRHERGSVLIYDSGRPYHFEYGDNYSALLLRVPRTMIESRFLGVRDLGGALLAATRPQARLISGLVESLILTAGEGDLPENFVSPVLDLIAGAFQMGDGTPAPAPLRGGSIGRVKRFLAENFADESLSVDVICREQNVSVRTLNRMFAADGTTPMLWLRSRRLASARAMLGEGRVQSVTEAAFACGFSDVSYFGRCFRQEFGITPKQAMPSQH